MKTCPVCNAQAADDAVFCVNCGNRFAAAEQSTWQPKEQPQFDYDKEAEYTEPVYEEPKYQQTYSQPQYDPSYYQQPVYQTNPYDHTAEFDPRDISDNKVICMLIYLMSVVGVVLAMLAKDASPYVSFHVRQALKFLVIETLVALASGLLCWTLIVPVAGGCLILALSVVKIICFFQICNGKAVEPAIIRSIGFLK